MSRDEMQEILTVTDIQKYLGIGKNLAYELVAQERFKVIKFGRKIRIPKESFFNWIDSHV